MIRVQTFPCALAKADADALNRESGRHYTNVLVWHYRIYRRTGHWLSEYAAKRLEDYIGGSTSLHAHSRDAAQEGFYDACKVAKAQQKMGLEMRYPYRRHFYRTTTWKNTGVRVREGIMLLAQARSLEPVQVTLPDNLASYPAGAYKQIELVWDRGGVALQLARDHRARLRASPGARGCGRGRRPRRDSPCRPYRWQGGYRHLSQAAACGPPVHRQALG
jgi:putative transposase